MKNNFIKDFNARYNHKSEKILLGKAIYNSEVIPEVEISVPIKTINRHGLIAGATGTGKTKSLQVFVEQLSLKGIPSLVMDIKGDFSGISMPSKINEKITERYSKLNLEYIPKGFPVEFLSISNQKGVKLKATLLEFGPILFSKILNLNNTQQSILSIVFKYCEDKMLPLIDLSDLKQVLKYITENSEGKIEFNQNYGAISTSSLGAILRNIVSLEQEGASIFFGEPSFDVQDLIRTKDGLGIVSILRLMDIQTKPTLFSTFMLSLLSEIYQTFPEQGDAEPKLAIFIDEAHLIFKEASKTLLDQIETVIKLIRSKGIGVYFITQVPADIPENILSQLGLKIQHALRGTTAKDKKEINKAVENYPISEYYKANELIQQLGIGETLITCLDEKGIPTPLAHTFMVSPQSRMDVVSDQEVDELISKSELIKKYNIELNKDSAYEILLRKINQMDNQNTDNQQEIENIINTDTKIKEEPSMFESILNSPFVRDIGRTAVREGTKMLFGMLGLKSKRR